MATAASGEVLYCLTAAPTNIYASAMNLLQSFPTLWTTISSDRGLSITGTLVGIVAIMFGAAGIWRAEYLFRQLDKNLNHLIEEMKKDALQHATTVAASYAAFTRALQAIELDPKQLPKDGAFALLTSFYFQNKLNPGMAPEDLTRLHKNTRQTVEKIAREHVNLLLMSGMGKMKDGIRLTDPPDTPK